jgi:hypothetical protein
MPEGTVSVIVTVPLVEPAEAPFDTVTLYAPVCPCVKFPVCVLAMVRLGQNTVVAALDWTELLLPADTVAVFEYTAQLAVEVLLVMCIEAVAPAPKSLKEQPSAWLPATPAIEQLPGPAYDGLMLQLMPVPAGSGSFNVAAIAVPAPLLLTAMVYPIETPAETVAASAVLVKLSMGGTMFVTSLAVEFIELTAPSLDTEAVLVTGDGALLATFTVRVIAA